MFHSPIRTTQRPAPEKGRAVDNPFAGIVLALPFSLALWAMVYGLLRAWL